MSNTASLHFHSSVTANFQDCNDDDIVPPTPEAITNSVTTTIAFFPLGMGIFVLSFFGIFANILSAIVLLRPSMVSTYTSITIGLTFCDTVHLLTKLLRYGLQSMFTEFSVAFGYTHIFYPLAGPSLRALTSIGFTYFTMAVAADRYFVVCWPLQARKLWTRRKAHFLEAGLILFSILFNMPRWWEFHTEAVTEVDQMNHKIHFYEMRPSPFRFNPHYRVPYKICYLIVMNFIPFFSLTFFNWAIWQGVRESIKRKETLTSRQRKDKSFALMLVAVVVVFLVCSSVYFVLDIVEFSGITNSLFWDNLGNFLLTLNSAINFGLYCAFGRKFRKEFVMMTFEFVAGCKKWISRIPGTAMCIKNLPNNSADFLSTTVSKPEV